MKTKGILTLAGIVLILIAFSVVVYAITVDGDVTTDGSEWSGATCFNDSGGSNDPKGDGQKDVTRMCAQDPDYPTTIEGYWNWDEIGTSGANSLDACLLFDTDGDGNANYATCVTTQGSPVTLAAYRVFTCNDDDAPDACGGFVEQASPGTVCAVNQNNNDPFTDGNDNPTDTTAECSVAVSDIGGAGSIAINVCSYPSASVPSSPSDCIDPDEDIPLLIKLADFSASGSRFPLSSSLLGILGTLTLLTLAALSITRFKK